MISDIALAALALHVLIVVGLVLGAGDDAEVGDGVPQVYWNALALVPKKVFVLPTLGGGKLASALRIQLVRSFANAFSKALIDFLLDEIRQAPAETINNPSILLRGTTRALIYSSSRTGLAPVIAWSTG